MAFTDLNFKKHQHLKVKPQQSLSHFAKRHLILIRAEEVTRAACNMPVMLTAVGDSGQWSLAGVTSFEPDSNLFLTKGKWTATFVPWLFQTWPFNLIPSNEEDVPYYVGLEENSEVFSKIEGEALFDADGQPSEVITKMKSLLENQLSADVQTVAFTQDLINLGLNKPITVQIQYQSGAVNSIRGLHTIDEEKLQSLDVEALNFLKERGYLTVIYGLLISLYQFNALIQHHNQLNEKQPNKDNLITKISMEAG